MFNGFFKRLFCKHTYKQTASLLSDHCISIQSVCTKCGKEEWETIRF